LPIPTFLSENAAVPLAITLTTSLPSGVTVALPASEAVTVVSYTLLVATSPVTDNDAGVMLPDVRNVGARL
jgi:hypothetical protein